MDKGRKLKRYGRKDYSQLVEFPVEIIGRDGVVRRYNFEQSVQLYQRRIASAGLRYSDASIVHAEVGHCRQRIQQLRRSYFVRHGWPALEQLDVFTQTGPGLAADLASFLRRTLAGSSDNEVSLSLSCLPSEGSKSTIFIQRSQNEQPEDQHFLVYMYGLTSAEGCRHRAKFFEELKVLQRNQSSGTDVELLVGFHHSVDCGLILTQVSGEPVSLDAALTGLFDDLGQVSHGAPTETESNTQQRAMQLLKQGRHRSALRAFVTEYEENPLNRQAYLGAIVAADLIGAVVLAETAALMGSRVLKGDSDLQYHLVAVWLRQHRWDEAREAIAVLRDLSTEDPRLPLLEAVLAVGRNDYGNARAWVQEAHLQEAMPRQLQTSVYSLGAQLLLRRVLLLVSMVIVLGGLIGTFAYSSWCAGIAITGAMIALASIRACRRLFVTSLKIPGARGLRLADSSCLTRARSLKSSTC